LVIGVAVLVVLGTTLGSLAVDAITEVFPITVSVAEPNEALVDSPATQGQEGTLSVLGALSDDVDYRVDSVCAPDGAARSSDDFDPIDVFEQSILDIPIGTGKQRRVDATT